MTIIETPGSRHPRLIPIAHFEACLIDGKTRAEIAALYPGANTYYLQRFDRYLREHHQMTIKDYCVRYGGITWPRCPGTGKEVGYSTACGSGLGLKVYARGGVRKDNHAGFKAHCGRMTEDRRGEGNPMHGEEPWNKGITAADHPSMARVAAALVGRPVSEAERQRRSEQIRGQIERNGPLHATPHSNETKERLRRTTAACWATGGFGRFGPTSIQIRMRQFLQSLPLTEPFVEEQQEVYYSLDFAFKAAKLAIECDGDYFHINPRFYPDGPKDAIQRRNAGRDRAKDRFLAERGWTVIRLWECDINAGTFREPLLCKLRQSGLLND